MALNKVDLPTFGRPINATTGSTAKVSAEASRAEASRPAPRAQAKARRLAPQPGARVLPQAESPQALSRPRAVRLRGERLELPLPLPAGVSHGTPPACRRR
jgi:hypothetical protein